MIGMKIKSSWPSRPSPGSSSHTANEQREHRLFMALETAKAADFSYYIQVWFPEFFSNCAVAWKWVYKKILSARFP